MKKLAFLLMLLIPIVAGAQDVATAAATSFWTDPLNHPMLPVYLVSAFIFIVLLLVLATAIYIIKVLNFFTRKAAEENAVRLGKVYTPQPSWGERVWEQLNASVPVTEEKTIELAHDYDGIKELDNHLPPWWKWLFYGTIAWSLVYMVVYHVSGSLPLSIQEYDDQVIAAEEAKQKFIASQPVAVIDENTLKYEADVEMIAKGKKVFITNNCQSCHRPDGGGNAIGPNLTDPYWIHGGSVKEVFLTVKNGVVEKGMPAWGKVMSPKDVRDVTFYIMSLQGTNPPNAKAAQGALVKPELSTKADTTKVTASMN
jgi:cytochrome c oxidase cbb3-type subunit 3